MPRLREVALQFGPLVRTQRPGLHYAEGDIILEREPTGRIGIKEAQGFVWVLVLFPDDLPTMGAQVDAADMPLVKARFNLTVAQLQAVLPSFDVSRARDPDDVYQPFLPVVRQRDGDFAFQAPTLTLTTTGRLFDKQEGRPK